MTGPTPTHDAVPVEVRELVERLSRLCSPDAEVLSDGVRIDRFVEVGIYLIAALATRPSPITADAPGVEELLAQIMKLPRRVEPIGGQSCSYVALDDVMALCEQAIASRPDDAQRIREEERDRLYRKANADYIEAEKRGDNFAEELHSAAALWLGDNGGKSEADRAASRGQEGSKA